MAEQAGSTIQSGTGWETGVAAVALAGLVLLGGTAGIGIPLMVTAPLASLILVLVVLLGWMQARVLDTFYRPRLRRASIVDEAWSRAEAQVPGGLRLPVWYRRQKGTAPLVLALHGWESSPGRMKPRLDMLHALGCHVITFEYRGHGSAPEDRRFTAVKTLADARAVLNEATKHIPRNRISSIIFYGHSLGGFVGLRLSSNARHWWGKKLSGVVLESPMVDLMQAIDSEMRLPATMLGGMPKRWIINEFRRVHPELAHLGEDDFSIPHWGLPSVPVLTIQSEKDGTLGRHHYDLVVKHITKDHEHHLISDLEHGSHLDNATLNEKVGAWMARFRDAGSATAEASSEEPADAPAARSAAKGRGRAKGGAKGRGRK